MEKAEQRVQMVDRREWTNPNGRVLIETRSGFPNAPYYVSVAGCSDHDLADLREAIDLAIGKSAVPAPAHWMALLDAVRMVASDLGYDTSGVPVVIAAYRKLKNALADFEDADRRASQCATP